MTPLRMLTTAALLAAFAATTFATDTAKPGAPAPAASGAHKGKGMSSKDKPMHNAKGDADCKAMMDKQHDKMGGSQGHDKMMGEAGKPGDCPAMK